MNIFMTSSYGFNNFVPTMVRGFGVGNRTISLLLTAPPYILGTAVSFLVAWSSDRQKERGFHIMANNCCAIVGFIISVATLNTAARYTAAFLYTSGSFSANALVYTWAVSSLGQTPEKRAAGGAIVNICGHLGNVVSTPLPTYNRLCVLTFNLDVTLFFSRQRFTALHNGYDFADRICESDTLYGVRIEDIPQEGE